jgi:hypothetical protein
MTRLIPLLLMLLAPSLMGMSKKKEFSITFHAQAESNDMQKTFFPFVLEGQRVLFKIVPELSQQNIVSFHPFPSENGNLNGVALQVDFSGKSALEIATRTRQGEYLLAMVNGVPVDYVVLDKVITDGFITIWQGVPDEVIKAMEKKYARIKPGGAALSSSDRFDDMAPSTKKEKKRAFEEAKKAEKEALKNKDKPKAADPRDVTIPKLPAAPTAPSIPVEGGAEPTAPLPQTDAKPLPPSELNLPKR